VLAPTHAKLVALVNDLDALPEEAKRRLKKFLEPFESIRAKLKKKKEEE
jgi:hypothetical protein